MTFRVSFADIVPESDVCRIFITAGDVQVRSYPQSVSDHFRDLVANRNFLAKRVLANFFSGEEPLISFDYTGNDVVSAHIFKEDSQAYEKLFGDFLVDDALSHLDEIIGKISATLSSSSSDDREALLVQVARDVSGGVYDVYLKHPN